MVIWKVHLGLSYYGIDRSTVIITSNIPVYYAYPYMFLSQQSLATDLQNLSVELSKKQSTYLKQLF